MLYEILQTRIMVKRALKSLNRAGGLSQAAADTRATSSLRFETGPCAWTIVGPEPDAKPIGSGSHGAGPLLQNAMRAELLRLVNALIAEAPMSPLQWSGNVGKMALNWAAISGSDSRHSSTV